jgi:hypothetical protein
MEMLQSELIVALSTIAEKAGKLKIKAKTPSVFFAKLITALYDKYKTKVVILIDEYDDPVTSNMDKMKVAKDNAKVLSKFFATLKKTEVSECIRFTFVTGITRYALTSMDSGPNHLDDISLLPEYAGICGFTLEEFDSLFADRMDSTMANYKDIIDRPSTPEELRSKILRWYDGYNWGGGTRILNPYSILNFFDKCEFDKYWIQSGRPSHLTTLIQQRPQDFLRPILESYLSSKVRKPELANLEAAPVLFHCGYLTIDKKTKVPKKHRSSGIIEYEDSYTFVLPNFEVDSSYFSDYFNAIFPKVSEDVLQKRKEYLKEAMLSKDALAVAQFFRDLLTSITYHQRPEGEKTFHAFVQLILEIMGFNLTSEQASYTGRSDICLELRDKVYCILELKYCPAPEKLTKEDIDNLSLTASVELSKEVKNRLFTNALRNKLESTDFDDLVDKLSKNSSSATSELYGILAHEAKGLLSEAEIKLTLAEGAMKELPEEKIKQYLNKPHPGKVISLEGVDALLSKAAQLALDEIKTSEYQGAVRYKAKDIIEMGMAVYGGNAHVKVQFG